MHTQWMLCGKRDAQNGIGSEDFVCESGHFFFKGQHSGFLCAAGTGREPVLCDLQAARYGEGTVLEKYGGFSEGQKKKVLLAASLLTPAHLYIWDEPLNYIDVFSRMQIEKLILSYMPTMLVVEHDVRFRENIATKVVKMGDADDGQKD